MSAPEGRGDGLLPLPELPPQPAPPRPLTASPHTEVHLAPAVPARARTKVQVEHAPLPIVADPPQAEQVLQVAPPGVVNEPHPSFPPPVAHPSGPPPVVTASVSPLGPTPAPPTAGRPEWVVTPSSPGWQPVVTPMPVGRIGRRPGWKLAAALVVLLMMVFIPLATRGGPKSTAIDNGKGGGAVDSAPIGAAFTQADAAALLERFAGAQRTRDGNGYLDQLDQGNAQLVASAKTAYANFSQLDLETFKYVVTDSTLPEPDPTHPGGWTKGWVQAWRLSQIRGIDPKPAGVPMQYGLTVDAKGRLLISDIEPRTDLKSARAPMPWDVSPLTVVRGQHVLVAGTADVKGKLGTVMREAEAAIADAGPCWPASWQHTFTIFATGARATFDNWYSSKFTSTEFIGYELGLPVIGDDGAVVPGAEDDVPQVVIDVPGASSAPLGFRSLLEHELTHAAAGAQRNPRTEIWAVEGYADFVAFHSVPLRQANRGGTAYRQYHSKSGLVVKLPTEADFYGTNAALNYDLAFLAFYYMKAKYGDAAVVRFFAAANSGGSASKALYQVFHLSEAQFTSQWSKWTFQQLA